MAFVKNTFSLAFSFVNPKLIYIYTVYYLEMIVVDTCSSQFS